MKRYTLIKNFIESLEDNDVAIFSGDEMCREAYQYDRPGNFYIKDTYGLAPSFALGMAMCTNKRIFVLVGEGDLLREFSIAPQLSASKCENLFLVVLDNGVYQSVGKLPNIMNSINSKRGVMFNMGLVVFDFTVYLRKKEFKKMRSFMKSLRGPVVLFFDIDTGIKKDLPEVDINYKASKVRLMEFLANEEIGTSMRDNTGLVLNVNDVKTGGIGNDL